MLLLHRTYVEFYQGYKLSTISIIGFGNHVKKNILPALNRIKDVYIECIYVRDTNKYQEVAQQYSVAIKQIDELNSDTAEWIYISTPIALHYEYVKQALEAGKHVICEKPLTDSLDKTQELIELAERQQCMLHEVCVYKYHKQYSYLKDLVKELDNNIKTVHAKFAIPHLKKSDIRYQKTIGGGALLDVGYYPVSIFINLFGTPKQIHSVKKFEPGFDVDLTGMAVFEYDEFYCIAEWGIGLPYTNELTMETSDSKYTFSRIFSKPSDFKTNVEIINGFEFKYLEIGEDDQFVNMFSMMLKSSRMYTSCNRNVIETCQVINSVMSN